MKTTLEIPDAVYRRSKSVAALRGESLKDFVNDAIRAHLERVEGSSDGVQSGWRRVFGKASAEIVAEVDRTVEEEFESVDPAEWS